MKSLWWVMAGAVVLARLSFGSPASAAPSDVYAQRYAAMMAGREAYDVMEPVPGAPDVRPLPGTTVPEVTAQALASARAYAQANASKALLIWRDGVLQAADYFDGATAATPLVSRSLAKPLTAIVVGRAIRLGYIRALDQPVSDFITEWRGGPKAAITVRELLDMRSGLLPQALATGTDDILNRAYLDPHHDAVLIREYPLMHAPGTHFDYANAVADLVAIVVERATHQRYARFVSNAVLKPLGAAGGSVWVDRPGGMAHSACCILLPAETWLRLAILLLEDGRWEGRALLPSGYVGEMTRPTAQNPYYGMGVYVAAPYRSRHGFGAPDAPGPQVLQSEPFQARDLFMFDGAADQVVYVIPSQRLIVLRLGAAPPKMPGWDNAMLPNTVLRGLIGPAPSSGPQPYGPRDDAAARPVP